MESIALPLGADPVRAIRADPVLWELASEQPPFCRPWAGETLPDISRELLAVLPAGAGWVHSFGDRSFEQAEYLLDPKGHRATRTWEERERSMAYRIVHGDEVFAEHATSGQGFRWRCSATAFLAAAVERIDRLDVVAVRRDFSVVEMSELGVYKVHAEEEDDQAFARVLAGLRAFADHCRTVVERKLDLIITQY
ncbi:hypothetical protein [Micromonospora sp. NPDC023633]|uniref:hypothetical protein n=1 Tax=Micromonospora sp. NPDC023633 TaxID=3154320 RepID=UPI003406C5CA